MPELPEMENYNTLLSAKMINKTIQAVAVNREKSINIPVNEFIQQVAGRRIAAVYRRAKHLLFELDSGRLLLLHLMLGGWMFYGTDRDKPDRTFQVILSFGDESLYFIGLRLGYLHLMTKQEAEGWLRELGPEPLEDSFTESQLAALLSDKRGVLKTVLTDQHVLSGIGNCYSDEICHHAAISPVRSANGLDPGEKAALYRSMRTVLRNATQWGGYMDDPVFTGDRLTGEYWSHRLVYDRGGEPCPRCRSPIRMDKVSSRKCFYCENCQR